MKILTVVGARPEFIQLAPLARALRGTTHEHVIVHTGQHYDELMSDVFFADLAMPAPDVMLGVGSGAHGPQTGRILAALDPVMDAQDPDWVVVFGDTNSTIAGALAAAKLHLPVAHVEAGLRSFNRAMPEEINRVATDHISDLLFAPTQTAMARLAHEGLAERARLVGDIKTEITFSVRDLVRNDSPTVVPGSPAGSDYVVATIHRAENTDDPQRLAAIVAGLAAAGQPVLLLVHPRLAGRAAAAGINLSAGSIRPVDPLPYPAMIRAVLGSVGVVTDSGGLQKEAFLLGVPCTTVRTETEWTETVELGWNVLCKDPEDLPALLSRARPASVSAHPYGVGDTAAQIVAHLEQEPRPAASRSRL